MANDPLPLPDISAEPRPDNAHGADNLHGAHGSDDAQEAEYEAIHAEIAGTERGRWFLSEHAKRNRAADTDRLVSSLVRAGAAMGQRRRLARTNHWRTDLHHRSP